MRTLLATLIVTAVSTATGCGERAPAAPVVPPPPKADAPKLGAVPPPPAPPPLRPKG